MKITNSKVMKHIFLIVLLTFVLFWIHNGFVSLLTQKENKMAWWNPSTWSVVDNFQNSLGNVDYTGAPNAYGGFTSQPEGPSPSAPLFIEDRLPLGNPPDVGNTDVQGTSSTPTSATDPYAKYGGKTAYDSLVSGFNTQKSNIYGTAGEAAVSQGVGLKGSILDFIDSLRSGQSRLDTQGINNEMALRQGREGIMGMVGRGIRSGGTLLANKNAADSSAASAIARAYGDIGRRQLSSVGNQYELENRNIQQGQTDLETQRSAGVRRIQDAKTQTINNLVLDARNKFAALDAQIAEASLPDRINIEQAKEQVRQDVLSKLAFLDQELANQSNIQPTSLEARRAEATRLAGAGQAPADSFNFTDQFPAQFQGGGLPSELPLFVLPRNRRTA